jgi:iron uptake system EfeUOB component EfeO/EfeM
MLVTLLPGVFVNVVLQTHRKTFDNNNDDLIEKYHVNFCKLLNVLSKYETKPECISLLV